MAVQIYKFVGSYSGQAEYNYEAPQTGEPHRCLLFLRQNGEAEDCSRAKAECEKYGFFDVEFAGNEPLNEEIVRSSAFRGLLGFYEEALEHGSSIAYYPNAE